MLGDDGVGATYIASTLAATRSARGDDQPVATTTDEQRLDELAALRNRGLLSEDEYQTQRQRILGSI